VPAFLTHAMTSSSQTDAPRTRRQGGNRNIAELNIVHVTTARAPRQRRGRDQGGKIGQLEKRSARVAPDCARAGNASREGHPWQFSL
jgi:hypothetical protein